MSQKIQKLLKLNILGIEEIAGAGNLSYRLSSLKNSICIYHALLDKDDAGIKSYEKALEDRLIDIKSVTFTSCQGMNEAEFEDCLKSDIYNDEILENFGVNLKSCKPFKQNKKWSNRVKECFMSQGKPWDSITEKKVKFVVANSVCKNENIDDILIPQKSSFLYNLVASIEGFSYAEDTSINEVPSTY